MLLEEATSLAEVKQALADGDEELQEDITDKLNESIRRIERNPNSYEDDIGDWQEYGLYGVIEDVKKEMPPEAAPFVEKAFRSSKGDFQISEFSRDGGEEVGNFTSSSSIYVSESDLPTNWGYIPNSFAPPFWEELQNHFASSGDGSDWSEGESEFGSNTLMGLEGTRYDIYYRGDFDEFKRDILRDYINSIARSKPREVIDLFLEKVDLTLSQNKVVQEELAQKKYNEGFLETLLDFAVQWFAGDESDADETLEDFQGWLDDLAEPESTEREELATVARADLLAMGLPKKGVFWENAPWRLVKLQTGDLRREGRTMRHCVGDKSTGYIQAVKNGEIEIWSLRDKSNKPHFTLEVAPDFYTGPDSKHRAAAIKQLKGATNRTPGFDTPHSDLISPSKRDEVVVWKWLMRKLDVSPEQVQDFNACRMPDSGSDVRASRLRAARALRAAAAALEETPEAYRTRIGRCPRGFHWDGTTCVDITEQKPWTTADDQRRGSRVLRLSEAADSVASKAHDAWARDFRRANPNVTTRMKDDGAGGQVDILNTEYKDLPEKWKKENKLGGQAAVEAVEKFGDDMEAAASYVHDKWLERNGSWAAESQKKPYSELSEEEKEKDRAFVRFAQKALERNESVTASFWKKKLEPDAYRKKHGRCPRSYHFDPKDKKCVETSESDLDVSDEALSKEGERLLEDEKAPDDAVASIQKKLDRALSDKIERAYDKSSEGKLVRRLQKEAADAAIDPMRDVVSGPRYAIEIHDRLSKHLGDEHPLTKVAKGLKDQPFSSDFRLGLGQKFLGEGYREAARQEVAASLRAAAAALKERQNICATKPSTRAEIERQVDVLLKGHGRRGRRD